MKNFEEFKNSITEEDIERTIQKFQSSGVPIHVPEKNASEFIQSVTKVSMFITFEILQSYHDWLNS